MQKVLIVGATSAIAESAARIYASRGARLYLLGRNIERLTVIAQDLSVRGASAVQIANLDVNDIAAHDSCFDAAWRAWESFDVVLVAHGTLPDQAACEASVPLAMREFSTNASSTIAMLIAIAGKFRDSGRGTIAVISSVAGDRGRASNYLYGAAKAAVSTFLSGLRQQLASNEINVITIKPGFVDTPMTRQFKKGLLWAQPDRVADGIVRAIDKRRSVAYLPGFWQPIMLVIRHIPEFIFKRVKL
jgi:short-subunit dehydrogenase